MVCTYCGRGNVHDTYIRYDGKVFGYHFNCLLTTTLLLD